MDKAAEIISIKLQLATQPGAEAVQELNDVECILRRLKETKSIGDRRKIAVKLDLANSRVKIRARASS